MTDDLFNTLLAHRQTANGQWVFLNPKTGQPYRTRKRWMNGLCHLAGVKPFGLHAIRHLTASILAKEGTPSIQIQDVLRHKRLTTTERYLHRLEDLKPVLQVLSRDKKPSDVEWEKTKIRVVK
jgi:integrase